MLILHQQCMANELSFDKLAQEGESITSLEIFFSGYPRMVGLYFFPRLKQLTIVAQNVHRIGGLECCPLLKELWVVECHLTEICGLQNCLQLEKIYLYGNQISEIQNLELQINVQVLWLNNNNISEIQGLKNLHNLKELNLADNNIEKIGSSLEFNIGLQALFLYGNKITSFKELIHLAHLPHLRELGLNDRMSTPNPVCLLCNYATHVLYHMPGLQRLDSYDVSNEQVKDAAESTVKKKLMYYNMRTRTGLRNLEETRVSLIDQKKTLLQLPKECIRKLSYTLKNLEQAQCQVLAKTKIHSSNLEDGSPSVTEGSVSRRDSTTDTGHDPNMELQMLSKMEALRERLKLWTRRMDEIEAQYKKDLSQAADSMAAKVQFLLMELESVGNIRLEEACVADPWFAHCSNLLLSRFSHLDYTVPGITGVKIRRVIRIHNHALRLCFEDQLNSLLASKEANICLLNYRRRLEYLFYVTDPERSSERDDIVCIVQEGFQTAEQYKALGRANAVPLSNSLSVAEQLRVEFALRHASPDDPRHRTGQIPFRHSEVIISKVFVGHSVPIQEGESIDRSSYPKAHSVYRNVDTKNGTAAGKDMTCTIRHGVIRFFTQYLSYLCLFFHSEGSKASKTHHNPEGSPRPRQWFVFDHKLVLPEYVVYFEYITEDQEETELSHFGNGKDGNPSHELIVDNKVLNMEPALEPQPTLLRLEEKILLKLARVNELSQITVLNLHANNLHKLQEISRLTALQHLTISFNDFTHLDDISDMPNLEFLDVSYNHLVSLNGLKHLGQLKQVDVSWNKLTKTREEAAVLRKHTPALVKLDTRYNPWKKPDMVRRTFLGYLSTLTHLDDVLVTDEEVASAARISATSKIDQVFLLAHSSTNSEHPRALNLLSTAQQLCQVSPASRSLTQDLDPAWTAQITALNLDGQGIPNLTFLDKMVNLRWASFNDNDICKMEGLDSCLKLEELSLNNNSISSLKGLSQLHSLHKLNVDGNQLSCLDASVLDQLPNLHFLSVENNRISSLHGIHRARSLIELYIGNNHISTPRDIYHLKILTNLIILDLYGNPLEKVENYRMYVVFHLPSLKALDGLAVEVTECENAKDIFVGRLNADMVIDKLGHLNITDINSLTLQFCSISMVDLAPPHLFSHLHSVNLEHNKLTSFSGLVCLPNIQALYLNYNHIESILPRLNSQTHLTKRQMLHNKVRSSGYGQQRRLKGLRDPGPAGSLEPLMGSLEVLHLSHNGISNLANLELSRLTNLKSLFLQGNEIRDVEGLEGLYHLEKLVLDKNRIKCLTANSLIAQTALLELHLAGNRIQELNHLDALTKLCKIFLCTNKLQNITELEKLDVLPSLTELSVVGNPVAQQSVHRLAVLHRLSRLQVLDGEMITEEERARAELLLCGEESLCCPSTEPIFPLPDINPTGFLPLMPHNTPIREMSVSSRHRNSLRGHEVTASNVDDAQPHCKCEFDISSFHFHKH
ncbi:leucine-rich repeat-containing protein 9 isoform X2 [Thalassophryne amazonica]|uniref:leucine-rich repeat-containing protein 9 isoform X2 n=1 Tax=Thalassophryne amazonica TaxID=390379 RepID=UPI0014717EE0|nr:leucine-rich repeat-containing protein 9 isoform X2 [Thalassophryne amazonica]